jgi:colanic acid biosynthesis glycosyl transferase WcaI
MSEVRVQLWSYNYDPEPQGIAPLSGIIARALRARGHELLVVAAHPHYPEPVWGMRVRPYRERRAGVTVLRLPLWPGRQTGIARVRQELTFVASLSSVAPLLPPTDVVIAVTPSFPALAPAMAFSRARGVPWVMWLQDIVTDGAIATGQLEEGSLLRQARRFERASYAAASRIVVISDAFRENLLAKGVRGEKIERIFNPVTREAELGNDLDALAREPPRILAMGNIGHSQGLERIVDAFEQSESLARLDAQLVIAGGGVAAPSVRARIKSERVTMPGVLYGPELTPVLRRASVGLVSQRGGISEFNLPSKLMNYMAYGIPVIASVNPRSETARIVRESGSGWVSDAADPAAFPRLATEVLRDREALRAAGAAGHAYAQTNFSAAGVAARFQRVIEDAMNGRVAPGGREPAPAGSRSDESGERVEAAAGE